MLQTRMQCTQPVILSAAKDLVAASDRSTLKPLATSFFAALTMTDHRKLIML